MVYNIYIFDSDLVWRMQRLLKVKKSYCVCREFLTFYTYYVQDINNN